MTRSRDIADQQDNLGGAVAPWVGAKNFALNGSFDIWQRGTSIGGGGGIYSADRWYLIRSGFAAGATVSRQVTGDTTNLPNIQYCARIQRDSGNTSTASLGISQSFETVNSIPLVGKTVVFSFYARKSSTFSGNIVGLVAAGTGTNQNVSLGYSGFNTPISITPGSGSAPSLTTTWQRYTLSGTIPTTATEVAIAIDVTVSGTAGADDWVEVTGVQLELGSQMTPFARAGGSIGGELALCQRYYAKSYAQSVAPGTANGDGIPAFFQATSVANNSPYGFLQFPMTMRAAPTITCYSYNGTVTVASRVNDAVDLSANTAAATTTNQFGSWVRNLNASTFTSSQGAMFHYTASAEL